MKKKRYKPSSETREASPMVRNKTEMARSKRAN